VPSQVDDEGSTNVGPDARVFQEQFDVVQVTGMLSVESGAELAAIQVRDVQPANVGVGLEISLRFIAEDGTFGRMDRSAKDQVHLDLGRCFGTRQE
jgi:hypothetical protein